MALRVCGPACKFVTGFPLNEACCAVQAEVYVSLSISGCKTHCGTAVLTCSSIAVVPHRDACDRHDCASEMCVLAVYAGQSNDQHVCVCSCQVQCSHLYSSPDLTVDSCILQHRVCRDNWLAHLVSSAGRVGVVLPSSHLQHCCWCTATRRCGNLYGSGVMAAALLPLLQCCG